MYKKQLVYSVILSTILTLFLLGAIFYVSDFAIAQSDVIEPSDGFVVATPETESLSSDGQPVFVEQTARDELEIPLTITIPLTTTPNMRHWFILGSHLLPRRSDLTYTYNFYGCLSITGGLGNRMQFPVNLPDGSVIKSMDIIYDDTSASNLTVWLSAYNPGVSNTDLIALSSTDNAGSGTASSTEITHVVDNSQNAYSIIYSWAGVVDSSLQICGIRINYIDPFTVIFLPNISNQ